MSRLYFTRTGAERILRKKQELLAKLKATQEQKAEAVKTGGNDWHDNFSFEQLTLVEQMTSGEISDINEKINRMFVVDKVSPDTSKLRMGHLAVLFVDGQEKTCLVGGFEDSDGSANPPVISYLAPLISPFLGEGRGTVAEVEVMGKFQHVTLLDIQLPQETRHDHRS